MDTSTVVKTRSIRPSTLPTKLTKNWLLGAVALCLGLLLQREARALTLTVVDGAGAAVTDVRWQLEEDNTAPGVPWQPTNNTVSLVIHTSHAPVIASGSGTAVNIPSTPGKRYALSVFADGFSMGAATVLPTDVTILVILKKAPLPPPRISFLAFHEDNPVHYVTDLNAADIPDCPVALKDYPEAPIFTDLFGDSLAEIYFGPNLRKDSEKW